MPRNCTFWKRPCHPSPLVGVEWGGAPRGNVRHYWSSLPRVRLWRVDWESKAKGKSMYSRLWEPKSRENTSHETLWIKCNLENEKYENMLPLVQWLPYWIRDSTILQTLQCVTGGSQVGPRQFCTLRVWYFRFCLSRRHWFQVILCWSEFLNSSMSPRWSKKFSYQFRALVVSPSLVTLVNL